MTSAMSSPTSGSAALMAATAAIWSRVDTGREFFWSSATMASTPLSRPRLTIMGLAPAVTFLRPSVTSAWPRTTAVVVPSPATSSVLVATSLRSCAPMFSKGVLELDLAGDGHAVIGDGGGAELLVQHHVAALGTQGHLDRISELVDAPLEGATSGLVEDELLRHGSVPRFVSGCRVCGRAWRRPAPGGSGRYQRPASGPSPRRRPGCPSG